MISLLLLTLFNVEIKINRFGSQNIPLDTGRKVNLYKTFKRRPRHVVSSGVMSSTSCVSGVIVLLW